MSALPPSLLGARAALVFLTRVPTGRAPIAAAAWPWASAYFSWVGVLVGLVAGVVHSLASSAGPWVASILAVGATMFVTGAMHEDGLADSADALGGSFERDKLFVILKDPRIGTFGASALGIVMLLRVACLATLGAHAAAALVFAHATSRLACTVLMATMPYVTADGVSKSFALMPQQGPAGVAGPPRSTLVAIAAAAPVAVLVVLGALGALGPLGVGAPGTSAVDAYPTFARFDSQPFFVATAAAACVTFALARWFDARAGGLTGDFLGAAQQLAEASILVVLAATLV